MDKAQSSRMIGSLRLQIDSIVRLDIEDVTLFALPHRLWYPSFNIGGLN